LYTRPVVKFSGVLPVALKLKITGRFITCIALCICIIFSIAPVVAGQCSDSCDDPPFPPTSETPSKPPDWVTDIFDHPPLPPITTPPMITPDPTPGSEAPTPPTASPPYLPMPDECPPGCGEDITVIPYKPPYILPPPPMIGPVEEPKTPDPFDIKPLIPFNELDYHYNPDPYNHNHQFVRGTLWLGENTVWLGDKYLGIKFPGLWRSVKLLSHLDEVEFSLEYLTKKSVLSFIFNDWWKHADAGFEFFFGKDWFNNTLAITEGQSNYQLRNYPVPPPAGDPFNPQP
jgi:hypothetical protein